MTDNGVLTFKESEIANRAGLVPSPQASLGLETPE